MLFLWLLHFSGVANGQDLSKCIPGATDLGPITLKNSPYFNSKVYTPIQMAVLSNDTGTAFGFLWEMASANTVIAITNRTDHQGMTLLHWAALEGNAELVKSLLCFGSPANGADNEGNTPLHLAAEGSSPATIQELVSSGGDINAKNRQGSTPLHLAIKKGVFSVVLTLLANGAKTDIADVKGRVALDAAILSGNEAIIKLLKSAGATVKSDTKSDLYKWTDERGGWNPVEGGRDGHCLEKVYVGRVHHEGNILPAKVCYLLSQAYTTFGDSELVLKKYEILDSEHIAWAPMDEGRDIPDKAIVGGITKDGEKLYIGRANIIYGGQPYLTPGKVTLSDKILRVPYGSKVYAFKKFEILVVQ